MQLRDRSSFAILVYSAARDPARSVAATCATLSPRACAALDRVPRQGCNYAIPFVVRHVGAAVRSLTFSLVVVVSGGGAQRRPARRLVRDALREWHAATLCPAPAFGLGAAAPALSIALALPPDARRTQLAALQTIETRGYFDLDVAAPAPPDASRTLLAAPCTTETIGHFPMGAVAPALSADDLVDAASPLRTPLALAAPSSAMRTPASRATQGETEFTETKGQPDVYVASPSSHYGTAAAVPKLTADDDVTAASSMPQRLRRSLRRTTESIESIKAIGLHVITGYYPAFVGTAI
jgi:hypothetical protein